VHPRRVASTCRTPVTSCRRRAWESHVGLQADSAGVAKAPHPRACVREIPWTVCGERGVLMTRAVTSHDCQTRLTVLLVRSPQPRRSNTCSMRSVCFWVYGGGGIGDGWIRGRGHEIGLFDSWINVYLYMASTSGAAAVMVSCSLRTGQRHLLVHIAARRC